MAEPIPDTPIDLAQSIGDDPVILSLTVTDPTVCNALQSLPEGKVRDDFTLTALRIGVTAMKHAQGQIGEERIRNEGKRLVGEMARLFADHQSNVQSMVADCLKEYFDPQSGRFNERVDRLINKGGELEQLISSQVGGDNSTLAQTLVAHVGAQSSLMQHLDPASSEGLVSAMGRSTEQALKLQRERILAEFSLDNKDSALARMVAEIDAKQKASGEAMDKRLENVVSEFSLDREDSALSRLVSQVDRAQRTISAEFSLDTEGSALARLRKELLELMERDRKERDAFHRQVSEAVSAMSARKEEATRGTQHGLEFEDALFAQVEVICQQSADIATQTGNQTGLIKNCKVGDIVVELGPEQAAAGERIVLEAKQKNRFNLKEALRELETARKNRDAEVGIFVLSSAVSGAQSQPLTRYGNDFILVWDAEDPATDILLRATLSVATALCTRKATQDTHLEVDFATLDSAMLDLEKQLNGFDEITTSANTVSNSAGKILKRARIMREKIEKDMEAMNAVVAEMRKALAENTESGA